MTQPYKPPFKTYNTTREELGLPKIDKNVAWVLKELHSTGETTWEELEKRKGWAPRGFVMPSLDSLLAADLIKLVKWKPAFRPKKSWTDKDHERYNHKKSNDNYALSTLGIMTLTHWEHWTDGL